MGLLKPKKKDVESEVLGGLSAALPTTEEPWYRTKHLIRLNAIIFILLLSSASGGFDSAMMNGLQTLEQWREYFDNPTGSILGVMSAMYSVGNALGLLPAAWISDRYGRKLSLYIGLGILILGAAIQGAAQNMAMFTIARLILGTGVGLVGTPSPMLITELAYPTHRAKVTSMYNTFYYLGAILAAWSTYGTFVIPNTWSWRIPSIVQGALPLIQIALIFLVPESPRWLVAHGKVEEARQIFVRHHAGGDEASALVEYEMFEIEANIRLEASVMSQTSYMDLIKTAPNRRRTLIAVLVGFGAQWNGVQVVSYYLSLVLNTIGITDTPSQALINGLLQVFNWAAAIFAGALMVDRLGRRSLFLISTAGMTVSYVVWTALTSVFTSSLNHQIGNAVVAFIFIYYLFYDMCYTPLLVAYPAEIFPYTLRGRGLSATYAATYSGLIIGQFVNPIAMDAIGWKYYIVFCVLNAMWFVSAWFLFPETKGRTLEQIAEVFDGQPHAIDNIIEEKKREKDETHVEHVQDL
ncbi:glucose transporter [Pseudomassariella vexata]|uniref:Glucose transporter n=1 Tax=Pseudomassariella vexata TaxID=1141098 RepID=A0A1Y2DPE3_9PEZI|nr:glucose transporter [Pseudomassariella vexata]ORY61024.1 glucose transporter [Pseudomassariella vexata]